MTEHIHRHLKTLLPLLIHVHNVYAHVHVHCTCTCKYTVEHTMCVSLTRFHTADLDPGINKCYRAEVWCGKCREGSWSCGAGLDSSRGGGGVSGPATTRTAPRRSGAGHGLIACTSGSHAKIQI